MTARTFTRLMLLLIIISSFLLLFASDKKSPAQAEECPASQGKIENKQAQSDVMIWESISQHLLSSIQ